MAIAKKTYTRTVRVSRLAQNQQEMFEVFASYYDNAFLETFERDLAEKEVVFLIRCAVSRKVVGFSTLKRYQVELEGEKAPVFFSGDTIVHKDYWGKNGLGLAFGRYLLREKLKHPLRPVYWNLISKGYKTYLLLTNNFGTFYPRYDQPTPPRMQALIDACGRTLYPENYNPASGVIEFASKPGSVKDRLKGSVACIEEEHLKNPKIAFFQQRNPRWESGDELVCLGEFTLRMFLSVLLKKARKNLKGKKLPHAEGVVRDLPRLQFLK